MIIRSFHNLKNLAKKECTKCTAGLSEDGIAATYTTRASILLYNRNSKFINDEVGAARTNYLLPILKREQSDRIGH